VSRPKIITIRKWGTANCMREFGFDVYSVPVNNLKSARLFMMAVKEIQPDIFFFSKDESVSPSVFKRVRTLSPNTACVMLYWDQRGRVPGIIKARRGCIDSIIINNADPKQFLMYKKFGIKNVYTLYDSANSKIFNPINKKRTYDLIFGGSNYKNLFPLSNMRLCLLGELKRKFNMIVYGNGWPFQSMPIVRKNKYCEAIQNAKISLGINHYDVYKYYEERFIECMAAGRMHLTYYIPGMENDFGNRKHVVWFKSVPECVDLVRYYLKYPNKREEIGRDGRKRIFELFDIKKNTQRLSNILKDSYTRKQAAT